MRGSLAIGIMAVTTILGRTEPVVVSGEANPWLSGMPTGSTASKCIDTAPDTAPAQAPVQVATIRVYQGQSLTFSAAGAVSHDSSSAVPLSPPDGKTSVILNHEPGAQNVAMEAGNSPSMIHQNYRELVTAEQAKAWFSIVPPPPRRVGNEKKLIESRDRTDPYKRAKWLLPYSAASGRVPLWGLWTPTPGDLCRAQGCNRRNRSAGGQMED